MLVSACKSLLQLPTNSLLYLFVLCPHILLIYSQSSVISNLPIASSSVRDSLTEMLAEATGLSNEIFELQEVRAYCRNIRNKLISSHRLYYWQMNLLKYRYPKDGKQRLTIILHRHITLTNSKKQHSRRLVSKTRTPIQCPHIPLFFIHNNPKLPFPPRSHTFQMVLKSPSSSTSRPPPHLSKHLFS